VLEQEKLQQQIVAANQGVSVGYAEPASCTETSPVDETPFVAIQKSPQSASRERIQSECLYQVGND
jgi:hypothetical protein